MILKFIMLIIYIILLRKQCLKASKRQSNTLHHIIRTKGFIQKSKKQIWNGLSTTQLMTLFTNHNVQEKF